MSQKKESSQDPVILVFGHLSVLSEVDPVDIAESKFQYANAARFQNSMRMTATWTIGKIAQSNEQYRFYVKVFHPQP
ncbi:MAG: hypothetical protein ACFFB7_07310 [Candidatus Sifarchaeia archaeon]